MAAPARQVFVISDLHLGGEYPADRTTGDRGFRICTHVDELTAFVRSLADRGSEGPAVELVINGDLVDFLAERNPDAETGSPWRPFNPEPDRAAKILRALIERDRQFFDALGEFLARGHRLVILLGNHDVELALTRVQEVLVEALDAQGKDFEFIHDGTGYRVGDALIQHGNDHDRWNLVNFRGLAALREAVDDLGPSGLGGIDIGKLFDPPAGNHLVAEVINPIKEKYRVIDLLKPQETACLPLLLALEPGYLRHIRAFMKNLVRTLVPKGSAGGIGFPIGADGQGEDDIGMDMSAGGSGHTTGGDVGDPLALELAEVLGEGTGDFLESLEGPADQDSIGEDIGVGSMVALGFQVLWSKGPSDEARRRRMRALLKAVRAFQDDTSFDRSREGNRNYMGAAEELAAGPIRHVVFGHTHLPKRVHLASGGYYLNSGTWADVLRFPNEMIQGDEAAALERLEDFAEAIARNDFSDFTLFNPTYVRLDVDASDVVVEAELCDYRPGGS